MSPNQIDQWVSKKATKPNIYKSEFFQQLTLTPHICPTRIPDWLAWELIFLGILGTI